ncbi:MAG TPA: inorganic phosphate transporter, partial [Sandaracinaceae bacterium]
MRLDPALSLFVLGVLLAYVYAFVSGFTDAANAIATAVGTRAFSPRQAVLVASVFELLGALTGTAVALTIGEGIVSPEVLSPGSVAAALLAAMSWSLLTFRRGIPVSETHGLIGGIIGAGLVAGGFSAVHWWTVVPVLAAIIVSPALGFAGAMLLLSLVYHLFARAARSRTTPLFVNLQRLSALYVAFSHGRNDAQKPMGVLAMALATYFGGETLSVPLWVIVSVAAVAGLGVAAGGWRIVRTLGMRVTDLSPV